MLNLSPSFMGNSSDANEMKSILEKYLNTDKTYLCRLLKEEIYAIENIIKIKEFSKN